MEDAEKTVHQMKLIVPFLFLIIGFCQSSFAQATSTPLIADFTSDLTYTCDGTVQFQDLTSNTPTSWLWQFGDGGVSTQQNPIYTYGSSGVYTVSLQVSNAQGVNTISKTAYVTIEKPRVTSVNNVEVCPNMPATLTATNGTGTLRWYDGANALVHTGASFTTPNLTATTTYFVEEAIDKSVTEHVGPLNPAAVGGGGNHTGAFYGGVNFTAIKPFELVSVFVQATGGGNRTIYLWSGFVANGNNPVTNTIVDQITVNIPNGQSRVLLNFQIPAAGNYCIGGNQMNLYRNNSGVSYPYSLTGVVDMVSATTTSNNYYYFYDWELNIPDECVSAREAIVAKVVDANFSSVISGGTVAFTDNSTGATNWHWDFGDGNTSTQQNPVHTYTTTNGPHYVTLTINNNLCSFMDSVTVSVGINQLADGMTLSIFPNPTKDEARLQFSQDLPEDVQVEILSVDGRTVQQHILKAGTSTQIIEVNNLPAAVYLVRFSTDTMVETRKLVVTK